MNEIIIIRKWQFSFELKSILTRFSPSFHKLLTISGKKLFGYIQSQDFNIIFLLIIYY